MTPEQAATLRHFQWDEFSHPELVDYQAAVYLDDVRTLYAAPLTITCAARTPGENAALVAQGSSPNSLHLSGRAFDLRMPATPDRFDQLIWAIQAARGMRHTEIEVAIGPTNQHVHVGYGVGTSTFVWTLK